MDPQTNLGRKNTNPNKQRVVGGCSQNRKFYTPNKGLKQQTCGIQKLKHVSQQAKQIAADNH